MRLKNKVAIVTGAGAGIGRASSLLFSREGAKIVAVDLDRSKLDSFADEITKSGGAVASCMADVSQSSDVKRVVSTALNEFGRVDILFNNAGVVPQGKIHETNEDEWDRVMAVNVKSMYLFCHEVVPLFRAQGGGVILNTASATVLRNVPDRACYTASKSAVLALTRSMALDYASDNIRANCLCPGTVDTPALSQRLAKFDDPQQARKNFIARQPMGRFGTAEEIAEAALYLVSPESSFVTGLAFAIDGGLSL
jgi:NAD(P)-dependent dehydrogenase (short-subunit alcohol dehydrogenase family)